MIGDAPHGKVTDLVFGVTSSNKSNSRYNPLPFEMRAILVYEFAKQLKAEQDIQLHIVGIPHYQPTERFEAVILKEITEQTEGRLHLTPANTVVFTSTPPVIDAYRELGFAILPGEYDPATKSHTEPVPNEIVRQIGEDQLSLDEIPLSRATRAVFSEMPEMAARIRRLFADPILTEQGDLTDTRNYGSYTRAMSDIVDLKYTEIKDYLVAGKIVDEGCADGVLIERIVRDYPDSDIIGVDLSAEMLARANEAKRAGAFGDAFVFFKQQNLITPISTAQERSVDTIICNSTLHELWSYGQRAKTVREYLRNKYLQLRPGGRLVIRDVVGPEDGDEPILLLCKTDDGSNDPHQDDVSAMSTQSRFLRFIEDFQPRRITFRAIDDQRFQLSRRDAMEFITKMDYTDNWRSEMHEEFGFWSFPQWKQEMIQAGFRVLDASHAYLNAWRVTHSFQPRVSLFDLAGQPLPFPVTNMILVGERASSAI